MPEPSLSLDPDSPLAAYDLHGTRIPYLTQDDLYVWGVDLSATQLDLTILDGHPMPGRRHLSTRLSDPSMNIAERCHAIFDNAQGTFARQANNYPPAVVAIEEPFGKGRPITKITYGLLLAAAIHVLGDLAIVYSVTPQHWKRASIGDGRADKQQSIATFIALRGGRPVDDNDADSFGIALWARLQAARIT